MAAGQGNLQAMVEVIEPVGNEVFLNLRYGVHELIARIAPGAMPVLGENLELKLASERLHFFDPQNGQRLEF